MIRVGIGFDAHQFADHRRLILGGVEIPNHRGLRGHSDADVLLHALADALLGAAGLEDLGAHFPDTSDEWKDAASSRIVEMVLKMLKKKKWRVVNADVTLITQTPRISPYRDRIRESLATLLHVKTAAVNFKATTTDHMGFTGRQEGIAAQAIVLITNTR